MATTEDQIHHFAQRFGLKLPALQQAKLVPGLRQLHRVVLRAFLTTGTSPAVAWLHQQANSLGLEPEAALARLVTDDLVHAAGDAVTVAYPFSGTPTRHHVQLDGGAGIWAMCAVDALGIPIMTGWNGTITSSDARTGDPIRIERRHGAWQWNPKSTVVLIAASTARCVTAASGACPSINFHTSADHAEASLREHAHLDGQVVDQVTAIEAARVVFQPLLGPLLISGILPQDLPQNV